MLENILEPVQDESSLRIFGVPVIILGLMLLHFKLSSIKANKITKDIMLFDMRITILDIFPAGPLGH